MKKALIIITLIITASTIALYMSPINYLLPGYHTYLYPPTHYENLLKNIHHNQVKMAVAYNRADSVRRDSVLQKTAGLMMSNVQQIFKYWYGTPWSMNGTTEVPGKGSIACGYFVTTVLRDVGFKIRRTRLAQMPSESMISELVSPVNIRRYVNTSLPDFVTYVKSLGTGLYVVGLDTHTGFLICQNDKLFFIHASGAEPKCVIREDAENSAVLARSSYRVVGKLSADLEFIKKWYTL